MAAQDLALATAAPVAESALYGPNTWVAYHSATNTALSCNHAARAGYQHFVRMIVVTADAATAAVNALTLSDGAQTIFEANLPTSIQTSPVVINFGLAGLPGVAGDAVTLAMTSTGNAANATIWMCGYTQKAP